MTEAGRQGQASPPGPDAGGPDGAQAFSRNARADDAKGRLGLPVLGYGVSGPLGSVVMRDHAAIDLIERAFSGGIRLFDSAPFYGRAQKRLGIWLAQAGPDAAHVLLSSKCGTVRRNGRMFKDWRISTLAAQIARTRQDFGGRPIDFLFLHGVPPRQSLPEIAGFLDRQQASGAVLTAGLCAHWHDDWIHAVDHLPLAAMMAPLHPGSETHIENAGIIASRGLAFLAIETMHVPRMGLRRSLGAADLWRNLQSIHRNGLATLMHPSPPTDRSALLRAAIAVPSVTTALMTSADPYRLAQNLAAAAG